jgi:hypothetical protein
MAVNETRSMNVDLEEGVTDGSLKKPEPNRGGDVEPTTRIAREDLHFDYYGYGFGRY